MGGTAARPPLPLGLAGVAGGPGARPLRMASGSVPLALLAGPLLMALVVTLTVLQHCVCSDCMLQARPLRARELRSLEFRSGPSETL